ncbi:MAG: ribonuclease III [Sorangiineae bacterium]|nr:ribonuclease III [Polyangiaceae bacterium]MEB2322337.1 ribonuclease III [Sorangiineae bacterium]
MRAAVAALFGLPEDAPHLGRALTHPSYANEQPSVADNQRLEFLGDAVLGFCVSELLFARYPGADEGVLTRLRAQLVNADALARWARRAGVAAALRLGRGADSSGLRDSTNVLADAVEALIAASYLDAGLDPARAACARIVEQELAMLEEGAASDPKSALQERVQSEGLPAPTYEVADSGGPAHARWFLVRVLVAGDSLAEGRGRSKRAAERAAAAAALELRAAANADGATPPEQISPGEEQPA